MEGQEQYDRATKAQAQAVGMQNNQLGALGGSSTNIDSPYHVLLDQLSGCIGRAEMVASSIDNVDRRLHGNCPQPPSPSSTDKEVAQPNGYMQEVSYQMERLIRALNEAESAVNQLDSRVNI